MIIHRFQLKVSRSLHIYIIPLDIYTNSWFDANDYMNQRALYIYIYIYIAFIHLIKDVCIMTCVKVFHWDETGFVDEPK